MMKIVVNARRYDCNKPTGVGIYTELLYKHILEMDRENSYTFFSRRPARNLLQIGLDKVSFKTTIGVEVNRYLRFIWGNTILPFEINQINPDILHSMSYTFPLLIRSGVKKVATVYDLIWMNFPEYYSKDIYYVARRKFKQTCRSVDKIIAISESTKRDIIKYFDCKTEKIEIIHPGVEHERFKPMDINELHKAHVRKKYALPEEYILWLGEFRANKNIKRLCKSFIRAKKQVHINHKLVLCGRKVGEYAAIRDLIQNYKDYFIFPGVIDSEDLPFLYNLSSALIFPSIYEGFGLPVLEAMACGIPVITSNCSSLPEITNDAAILLNPEDEQEISEAITKMLTDESLRESLKQKGLERAKSFSWGKTAKKTLELFEEVMSKK